MAKRSKALPARKSARSRDDDSVLIRTAESLGRMIGSLQRQLQDATSHVSDGRDAAFDAPPELPQLEDVFGREKKRPTVRTKSRSSRGGARKKAPRKSAKSRNAVATKRSRSGAYRGGARKATDGRRRSRKTSRKR